MTKYTYKILKRQPHESLNGYGYSLSIYKDEKRVLTSGAHATRTMAESAVVDWLYSELERVGIIELAGAKETK